MYGPSIACRPDGEGGPGANHVYMLTEDSSTTMKSTTTDVTGNYCDPSDTSHKESWNSSKKILFLHASILTYIFVS